MKIYSYTQTHQQVNFTSKSQKFRDDYSQRIVNSTITQTNIKNLKGLTELFTSEGLTYSQVLKAAKNNPFMLVQKPETMEYNIREAAKRFAGHGITTETYLQSALQCPPLFSMSPNTVEKNMMAHAKTFAYDGLSVEDLFKMAKSFPSIFVISAKKLDKKADKLAQGMEVKRADIIEVFKKHPSITSLDTKTLIKKFKFLKYIEQNKYFDLDKPIPDSAKLNPIVLKKSLTNSMELNYLILLRNKISSTLPRGSKLPFDYLYKSIKDFIELNSKNTIELDFPADIQLKDFMKFVKKFSKSTIGKNIFRFKVI